MAQILRFPRKKKPPPSKQQGLFAAVDDARPTRRFRTDARPSSEAPPSDLPDSEWERKRRLKRSGIVLLFVFAFLAGTAAALFGPRGYMDVRRSREELERLNAEVEAQQIRVKDLRAEVTQLQGNPSAVERLAREELGYVRPGEITFLLPDEEAGAGSLSLPPKGQAKRAKGEAAPHD